MRSYETPRQVLEAVGIKLTKRANWCRGAAQKFGTKYLIIPTHQRCLWATMNHVGHRTDVEILAKADSILNRAAAELYGDCYIGVNENHGYKAVMRTLDRAVEIAKADEIRHLDFKAETTAVEKEVFERNPQFV